MSSAIVKFWNYILQSTNKAIILFLYPQILHERTTDLLKENKCLVQQAAEAFF